VHFHARDLVVGRGGGNFDSHELEYKIEFDRSVNEC